MFQHVDTDHGVEIGIALRKCLANTNVMADAQRIA